MNKLNENIIVTAYYIINNKRPSSDFNEWIKNFMYLSSLKVIYTDKKTFETLFMILYKNIINTTHTNIYEDIINNCIYMEKL